MPFVTEPTGYQKTILSDLQGAFGLFREAVVQAAGFKGSERALFHTDEAMSWESVRHLDRMPPLVLIIRNLCMQGGAPDDVLDMLDAVSEVLEETLQEFPR